MKLHRQSDIAAVDNTFVLISLSKQRFYKRAAAKLHDDDISKDQIWEITTVDSLNFLFAEAAEVSEAEELGLSLSSHRKPTSLGPTQACGCPRSFDPNELLFRESLPGRMFYFDISINPPSFSFLHSENRNLKLLIQESSDVVNMSHVRTIPTNTLLDLLKYVQRKISL